MIDTCYSFCVRTIIMVSFVVNTSYFCVGERSIHGMEVWILDFGGLWENGKTALRALNDQRSLTYEKERRFEFNRETYHFHRRK